MKRLHFPSFLIDRFDGFAITSKITTSQKHLPVLSSLFVKTCRIKRTGKI